MSYNYVTEKPNLFSEKGVEMLLQIRENAESMLAQSGAFLSSRATNVSGNSWTALAALDYLAERGEIQRVERTGYVWAQHEVFIAGPNFKRQGN